MKAWDSDTEILKEDIRNVPVCIKLPRLDIKCWGVSCLENIVSGMGKFVKLDNNTKNRERLLYARLLVDLGVDDAFLDCICFENEKGVIVKQVVKYERKPVVCTSCKLFGHTQESCKKKKKNGGGKKVWKHKGQLEVVPAQYVVGISTATEKVVIAPITPYPGG
ncbi:hypothetical protein RDABS01_023024 [Bienertia sinuspersici]